MTRLTGKIALVTGGSAGIGRATAVALAQAGATVVVAGRQVVEGEKTVRSIQAISSEAMFAKTDVTEALEVKALIDKTIQIYGRLDIAFNNAGIEGSVSPLIHQSEENWNAVMNTNLKGVWLSMKYEIPQMLKQGGGTIVNNSSMSGLIGFANASVYVASKHGVVGLTKSAALEYAKSGIRINAVAPGAIETDMMTRFTGGNAEAKAEFAAMHPMGRAGKPEEIAAAVVWLCSDQSSFITGHTLTIDGGYTVQ